MKETFGGLQISDKCVKKGFLRSLETSRIARVGKETHTGTPKRAEKTSRRLPGDPKEDPGDHKEAQRSTKGPKLPQEGTTRKSPRSSNKKKTNEEVSSPPHFVHPRQL